MAKQLDKFSNLVFGEAYSGYKASGSIRYRVVDDSVIQVCALRKSFSISFDVYYTSIPIFSSFELDPLFFSEANAFCASRELHLGNDVLLTTVPFPGNRKATISNTTACTEYAYSRLEEIKNLEDCRDFYESVYTRKGKLMRVYLEILLYYGEFEKCSAILEHLLNNAVKNAFANCNVDYPGDDQWRSYLPRSCDENNSRLEKLLSMAESSNWKKLRTMLAEKNYAEPYSELLENMKNNVKMLSRRGIDFGGKEKAIIEYMEKKLAEVTNT